MINIGEVLLNLWNKSGFAALIAGFGDGGWQNLVMIIIACVLLYLAIVKKFEPLLLCGIAFGCLLTNLPNAGLYHQDLWTQFMNHEIGYGKIMLEGGLLDIFYIGVKTSLYPCLIFMGVGAMTDFGPLLSNPKSLLLGAALRHVGFAAAARAALAQKLRHIFAAVIAAQENHRAAIFIRAGQQRDGVAVLHQRSRRMRQMRAIEEGQVPRIEDASVRHRSSAGTGDLHRRLRQALLQLLARFAGGFLLAQIGFMRAGNIAGNFFGNLLRRQRALLQILDRAHAGYKGEPHFAAGGRAGDDLDDAQLCGSIRMRSAAGNHFVIAKGHNAHMLGHRGLFAQRQSV